MITIFNREHLCTNFSIAEQANTRDALSSHGIRYSLQVRGGGRENGLLGTRSRTGFMGVKMENTYQYVFYVHRKDVEKAAFALDEARRRMGW